MEAPDRSRPRGRAFQPSREFVVSRRQAFLGAHLGIYGAVDFQRFRIGVGGQFDRRRPDDVPFVLFHRQARPNIFVLPDRRVVCRA